MTTYINPTPSLLPLSPKTDAPACWKIVKMEFTPDDIDVSADEILQVVPLLVVTVQPVALAEGR